MRLQWQFDFLPLRWGGWVQHCTDAIAQCMKATLDGVMCIINDTQRSKVQCSPALKITVEWQNTLY